MPNPGVTLVGVSGLGSIISSQSNSRAASNATDAQVQAANLGVEEQRRQFDEQMRRFDEMQQRLLPFVDGGNAAFNELLALSGLAPEPQALTAIATPTGGTTAFGYGDPLPDDPSTWSWAQKLQNAAGTHNQFVNNVAGATGAPVVDNTGAVIDPGTQPTAAEQQQAAMDRIANDPRLAYQMQQAEEALLANAAATGGVRGGNTAGILAELRPALFSQAIDRRYAELGNIANFGQSASGLAQSGVAMQANAGQNFANNASNLYGQIGAAQAGGALGGAAAFNQGLGGFSNALGTAFGSFNRPDGVGFFDQWGF